MTVASTNPVINIELNMARIDFGSAVFQGMPTDAWNSRLGSDPSQWIEEALAIRKTWLAKMASMGVNITISNTPIHPRSAGARPGSNPLADLIDAAFARFEAEGVGGVNGWKGQKTDPSDAVGDLRKSLAKAVDEAGARATAPSAAAAPASAASPQTALGSTDPYENAHRAIAGAVNRAADILNAKFASTR